MAVRRLLSDPTQPLVGYQVRWRDAEGKQRKKLFPGQQKRAAEAFFAATKTALDRGVYVDQAHPGRVRPLLDRDSALSTFLGGASGISVADSSRTAPARPDASRDGEAERCAGVRDRKGQVDGAGVGPIADALRLCRIRVGCSRPVDRCFPVQPNHAHTRGAPSGRAPHPGVGRPAERVCTRAHAGDGAHAGRLGLARWRASRSATRRRRLPASRSASYRADPPSNARADGSQDARSKARGSYARGRGRSPGSSPRCLAGQRRGLHLPERRGARIPGAHISADAQLPGEASRTPAHDEPRLASYLCQLAPAGRRVAGHGGIATRPPEREHDHPYVWPFGALY